MKTAHAAHAEGVTALFQGFKAAHPDSPMLRDGDVKTAGRIRYEEAFDAFLAAKKIADPARYRAD